MTQQTVYLDFDGDLTSYRNTDLGIDYQLNVIDSLISAERQQLIIDTLNEQYKDSGIYFTNITPQNQTEYSTVYVGRINELPEDNDIFGLSETIDVNNQIFNDNAFVFFDYRADDSQIISVISHELEHIVFGENHPVDSESDIFDYAAAAYMLKTNWGQGSPYNKYCPVDPVTGKRCVTGCTNTAAGQIIYYWLQNGSLDLQLTVDSGDNYYSYSRYTGANITISSSEAASAQYGYLSFSQLNNKLANFTVGSNDSIAALCFAAGVVQGANYSSSATGTAWDSALFLRAGFDDSVRYYGAGSNYIFYNYGDYGLTDAGWNLLRNELLAGRPVAVSIYSAFGNRQEDRHAIVADGYNSSTGKVHLNFGWSGDSNGWYSRYELDEKFMLYQLVVGITPELAPFLKLQSLSVSSNTINKKDSVTISFSVLNTGTATATATTAMVYSGNKLLQTISVSSLSAQNSRSYTCTVSASDLNLGSNTISVKVTTQESGKNSSQSAVVNVENSLPDLKIQNFSASVAKNTVNVSFSIANSGKTSSAATSLKLTLDGESYTINIPIIQSQGKTQTITRSFYGLSAGTYTVELLADNSNQVEETNETNNKITQTITITAMPDFVPWKADAWDDKIVTSTVKGNHKSAKNITADDDIYIDFGAKNIGDASSGSLRTNIYIDGKLFDYYLNVTGLDSSKTKTWEDINIGKLSAGTHTITVETVNHRDYNPTESNTSNNKYSKTITVAPGAPKPTKVDFAVVNNNRDEVFQFKTFRNLSVWESESAIYDISDVYMQFAARNLGTEEAGSFTVSVLIDGKTVKNYVCPSLGHVDTPWDKYDYDIGYDGYVMQNHLSIWDCHIGKLSAGTHMVTVVIDSTNAILESDESNNSYTQTLTVLPAPDQPNLLVSKAWIESPTHEVTVWGGDENDPDADYQLDYGADAVLKFTVQNIGNAAAEATTTSLHWGVNYIEIATDPLAPGESKTYSLTLPYMFYSSNNFYFNVNCKNEIQEVTTYDNETRIWCSYGKYNSEKTQYIVWDFTDLLITSSSISVDGKVVNSCYDSESVTVDFTIENIGSYECESVNVDILIDGIKVAGKEISGEFDKYKKKVLFNPTWDRNSNFYFHPEDFVPYEYTFEIGELSVGEHTVTIIVDPENESNDINTANNRHDIVINVEKTPDLIAPIMGNTQSNVSDNNVVITWDQATDNEGIAFYKVVIGDAEYTTDSTTISLKNVKAGTSHYKVTAYDTSGNASQTRTGSFHIAAPDLTAAISDIKRYIDNGNVNIEMTYTVSNQGSLSAAESKLYIMLDGNFYQTLNVPELAVGKNVKLQFTINGNLLNQSSHYIAVLSDGENMIQEENESDNMAILIMENIISENQDRLEWVAIEGSSGYIIEYSLSNFDQSLQVFSSNTQLDIKGLPSGTYQWRYCVTGTEYWINGQSINAAEEKEGQYFQSNNDQNMDIFFAAAKSKWGINYSAQHSGFANGWNGTGEKIVLLGKNKFTDVFVGSNDANILVLTDDKNGDVLFVDDIYTSLGDQARLSLINEIRAGFGDDIIDMTSQQFAYVGDGVKIYGGLGNDTIWANNGSNTLFGDAGNDRIIGGSDADIIVGGIGNDRLHGGGGEDIFCFGENWGNDSVEQLADGKVTLLFESGSMDNWNEESLTYIDGDNKVVVTGVSKENIEIVFADDLTADDLKVYKELGVFEEFASEKIFEDKNKGTLA